MLLTNVMVKECYLHKNIFYDFQLIKLNTMNFVSNIILKVQNKKLSKILNEFPGINTTLSIS